MDNLTLVKSCFKENQVFLFHIWAGEELHGIRSQLKESENCVDLVAKTYLLSFLLVEIDGVRVELLTKQHKEEL